MTTATRGALQSLQSRAVIPFSFNSIQQIMQLHKLHIILIQQVEKLINMFIRRIHYFKPN